MSPLGRELFLAAAGVVAGVVGTAGGITSLVSYPALLLAGVAPVQASVTNLVSFVACWPGSAAASRPELRGRWPWLRRWGAVAVIGGAGGALLLLVTPAGVFSRLVPFLVAAGSLALLAQPWLSARPAWRADAGWGRLVLPAGLLVLSVYSGYFGAGSGVLALALVLLTTEPLLPHANALKNMLVGAATATSAVLFALLTRVDWTAVAALAPGLFAGSLAGPWVARRLPSRLLRWLIVVCGLVLAVRLWLDPTA
ncbi:MAG TPA: sulfite exporter TauE/SafE family protein [Trebonia sp.]|nr:sulfite exporter TauE/SafE family protein [Trebonia sp.]